MNEANPLRVVPIEDVVFISFHERALTFRLKGGRVQRIEFESDSALREAVTDWFADGSKRKKTLGSDVTLDEKNDLLPGSDPEGPV